MTTLPVIDVAALVARAPGRDDVARRIGAACRAHGFFYVVGHGVDPALCGRLEAVARAFFALDEADKQRWRMALGGRAWRGWFPIGGELTSKFHWKSYQRDRSREGNPLAAHGERLRALDVPVLSVHASESTILTHDEQQEMLRRLRFGRGVEIAGATHSLHAERPDAVVAAMREFLSGT